MNAIAIDSSTSELRIEQTARPSPQARQLLVQVHATALNRADLLQRTGKYAPLTGESPIMGLEAAGEVVEVGDGCEDGFRVGDRVMGLLAGGGYAEYLSAHENLFCRIPTDMLLSTAASIPEAWMTAYQLIHFVAACQKGEWLLVHAAASGVGTAAIQLARASGIRTIATTSSNKCELVRSLGADHVVDYKQENFSDVVAEVTDGAGVNVILDCIGEPFAERNAKSLSTDARWIVYGFMGGPIKKMPNLFAKRASLHTTTLRNRNIGYKARLVSEFALYSLPLFSNGSARPVIDSVFKWKDVMLAHDRMKANQNSGKIVLEIRPEDS